MSNNVFSNLDRIYQSKDFITLAKQDILSNELNLSSVITNSVNDQITEADYLRMAVGFYIFDLVPRSRKEQSKPINFNDCPVLIENLMAAKFMQNLDAFNQMQNLKKTDKKTKGELPKDSLQSFSARDPHRQQERNGYLTLAGRVKAFFCQHNVHRDLRYLKSLLALSGNLFSQKQHVSLQKYFYSPELVSAVIEMKANPYCRDVQFLAFTLLATVPSNRRQISCSGRAKS